MPERWIGIVVGSDKVTLVDAEVTDDGPLIVQSDQSWPLQKGERASAYVVMFQHVSSYVRENKITRAILKESAVGSGATRKAHLEAAELRGVVSCACAQNTSTQFLSKAHISRTFGRRKVDEYISDDSFWSEQITGAPVRKGSREAAMILVAIRTTK